MSQTKEILEAYLRKQITYSSHEFYQEMIWRGYKAIEERDLVHLYGAMSLFKPDDFSLEKYSTEEVRRSIDAIGYDAFVSRIIEESFLRERLAGQFGYLAVEEYLRMMAIKAIDAGNISYLLADISLPCYDQGSFTYTLTKEELTEKLEKIGLLEYVRYQIWLNTHK